MEARLFLADWWETGVRADLEWRLGASGVARLTSAVLEGRTTTGWIVRRVTTLPSGEVLALVRVKPSQVSPVAHAYLFGECRVPGNACIVRWSPTEGLDAVFADGAGDAFDAAALLTGGG